MCVVRRHVALLLHVPATIPAGGFYLICSDMDGDDSRCDVITSDTVVSFDGDEYSVQVQDAASSGALPHAPAQRLLVQVAQL